MSSTTLLFRLLLAASLMLALCCCACSSSATAPRVEALAPAATLQLPLPASLHPRLASDSFGLVQASRYDATTAHNLVTVAGQSLSFAPSASGKQLADCAFAVFYAPVDDTADGKLNLSFHWDTAPPASTAWFGLGNRNRNVWEWRLIDVPSTTFVFDHDAAYIDANGGLLFALILPPEAGAAQLAYTSLGEKTDAGWHYSSLDAASAAPNTAVIQLGDVAVINGKPAILYSRLASFGLGRRLILASSTTATGANGFDWLIKDLGQIPDDGLLYYSLAQIGTGTGIAWGYRNNAGGGKLHYRYGLDPGGTFSESIVADNDLHEIHWPKLVDIGGLPGIVYIERSELGTHSITYQCGDAASGGTWTQTSPSAGALGDLSYDVQPRPLNLGGKPGFGALIDDGASHTNLWFFSSSMAAPFNNNQWTGANLGDVTGAQALDCAKRNGHIFLAANKYLQSPDTTIAAYELVGADPLTPADWGDTLYDNIGLGFSSLLQVFSFGSDFRIAAGDVYGASAPGTPFLGGSIKPLRLFSSSTFINTPADWQSQIVMHDNNAGISGGLRFIDLNGQLAYAAALNEQSADPDTGSLYYIEWGVLTP